MGLIKAAKERIAARIVTGWVKGAAKGEKGRMAKNVVEAFKGSKGVRSAVMLLLLVAEGLAKQFGFETGPLFYILHSVLGGLGVGQGEALDLGIDPAFVITTVASIYVAVQRFRAHRAAKKAAAQAEVLAEAKAMQAPAPAPAQ